MKIVTLTQLRHDLGSVLNWVEEGEEISVSKREKIVALISPPRRPERRPLKKRPDFAARLKRIYGDKVLPGNTIVEERDSRPY